MSSSSSVLRDSAKLHQANFASTGAQPKRLDYSVIIGLAVALGTVVAGIVSTGVHFGYFLQPTGALIVLGGTLGVTVITTPRNSLLSCLRRVKELLRPANQESTSREDLIEELTSFVKIARTSGLLAIEPAISQTDNAFLRETLTHVLDAVNRGNFQAALETKVRLRERQGEADAKVLEVAAGFAPTIGVIGTVVGLIDVFRQFSNLSAVTLGVGAAFVSTIYGLGLANLLLLPLAHRIRADVAERFETEEMIIEGGLCLFDQTHPAILRERLSAFLKNAQAS